MAETTSAPSANDGTTARRKPSPVVNQIAFVDVRAALVAGLRDLQRAPACGISVGAVFTFCGMMIYLVARWAGLFYLTYPLAAGFILIGPFGAIALYEVSRRLEKGESTTLRSVAGVVIGSGGRSLGWMPMLNLFIFFIWIDVAAALYLGFFGLHAFDLITLLTAATTTWNGFVFLVAGNTIGAIFAVMVFSATVVAYPLLLDRDADFITAIATSVKAVRTNPVPMLAYGLIVGVLMFLAILPALLGLIIVLPVLGHATWHLYRRVVSWPEGF